MSKVRGSVGECQTATAQERPRGATPRPRSREAAERRYPASEVRGGDKRSYPASEVRGGDERSYAMSEVRGSGLEEIPHAPTPPRPHARGQGRRPGGPTPRPRSPGYAGAGWPRGAIPR